jgi:DNA-binding MarR family transcriptional regulator
MISARSARLYHLLHIAAHRAQRMADSALASTTGLTTAQISVLSVLANAGPSAQARVAAELKIRAAAVTPMVTRLLARGLITRTRDQRDSRLWILELTPSGSEMVSRSRAPFAKVNEVLDAALDPDEIERLASMLARLSDAFGEHEINQMDKLGATERSSQKS